MLDAEDQFVGFRDVIQACLKLLHDFDGFQSWFGTTYPFRQRYIRSLILLQLQQVDRWLRRSVDREGHSSHCRAVSLYCTTSTLLEMDRDSEDDDFRVKIDVTMSSNGHCDSLSKRNSREHKSSHHFKILTKLHSILDDFPMMNEDVTNRLERNKGEWERLVPLPSLERHKTLLSRLLGIHNAIDMPVVDICVLLSGLKRVSDMYDGTHTHQWDDDRTPMRDNPEGSPVVELERDEIETRNEQQNGKNQGGDGESRETIDDMIIWRCILFALLFWTAPDSSDILSSGLWEHIIPIM